MRDITENRHLYDPEEQETEGIVCPCCNEKVSSSELVTLYDGGFVCKVCWATYRNKIAYSNPQLVSDFVGEHEKEYYLNYWFDNLEDEEKIEIVKRAYDAQTGIEAKWNRKCKVDFCIEHDDWDSYLKGE